MLLIKYKVKMTELPIKEIKNPWFTWIKEGIKTYEGRLKSGSWDNFDIGQIVMITSNIENPIDKIPVKIIEKRYFGDFKEAYEKLKGKLIIGDYTSEEVAELYREYFSDKDIENAGGVVAIKVKIINL